MNQSDKPLLSDVIDPPEIPRNDLAPPPPVPLWRRIAEMAAVLCLGFFPFLISALWPGGEEASDGFLADESYRILYDIQIIVPLLYIFWRSDISWAGFGIGKPEFLADTTLTLILVALAWTTGTILTNMVAPDVVDPDLVDPAADDFLGPSGGLEYAVLLVSLTTNSIVEEFVIRAYLITRLKSFGLHAGLALIISAAMFASYHVYQGYWTLVPHFYFGLLLGLAFVLTRRIWPLVVAHTIYNVLAYVAV